MELLLGGIAAVGAGIFTNPLEVIKIRMQLQGELKARGKYSVHYKNVFHAAVTIAKKEGILSLQNGLAPALCFQFLMNGTRLGIYHWMDQRGFTRDKDGLVDPVSSICVAASAGVMGGCVGTPMYLIKTHLQSHVKELSIAVGHQHDYTRMSSAFKTIVKNYGILGLFRGVTSTLPRITVASAAQLTTFEKSIEFIRSTNLFKRDSLMNAFLASLLSGFFVSVAMAPFDLISTRFYNQGVDTKGKGILYNSVIDCGKKIFREEGLYGFYKGWTANYFRVGPHTLLSLVLWDQLKYYYMEYKLRNTGSEN